MQYKVNHNGVNCILPVFTRGIKKKIDETNEKLSNVEISIDDRIDSMYEFLKEAVGEENLNKALGSDDLDEIDLNDLNILYLKITKEYDKPLTDFNKPEIDAETKKLFQEVNSLAKNMESVSRMAKK